MSTVISVKNISKQYVLGSEAVLGKSFREMVMGALSTPLKKLRRLQGTDADQERFWALDDVSFDIQAGEIVGVIGRNGAGKSTLLKILSRITTPTHGQISYRGRLASLLEVGTGFHPELTGRENIYLNGAILGMTRAEINQHLDQIVDFAEIAQFLDTPVKRYSSGMYVRLAFSVAAHLNADILLVDEVLAVGDSIFQKKCLRKMEESAREGKTVIFISHNMQAVASLCTRGIWLDKGKVKLDGDIDFVLDKYEHQLLESNNDVDNIVAGNSEISITNVRIMGSKSNTNRAQPNSELVLKIEGVCNRPASLYFHLGLYHEKGDRLCMLDSSMTEGSISVAQDQQFSATCTIPTPPLCEGRYTFNIAVMEKETPILAIDRVAGFYIEPTPGHLNETHSHGPLLLAHHWHFE
jgi:lipopolysaccharide transport system ATP-binding protein